MSTAHLKNKITNEIKAVERGSEEYLELAAQRITHEHLGDDAPEGFEEQAHRPLWEDRGVAAHAELGLEPAVGNINDRNYNGEDDYEPADDELATGSDRVVHANHEPEDKDHPAPKSKFARYRKDSEKDDSDSDDGKQSGGSGSGAAAGSGSGSAAQRATAAGAGSGS
jgi:hypothetical protein